MDRNVLISTAVVLLLSAFVGVNFVYKPQTVDLKSLEQAVKHEQELGDLTNDVSSMEKRLKVYRSHLMEKGKEEEQLIDRVREIAREVPVRVISMVPSSVSKSERRGSNFVSLRIIFEGSYHQLGTFISKVENSEKFMQVGSIHFSVPLGNSSQPITHEVEISTLRYF